MNTKNRIAAIRLMQKLEQNTEYAEKLGVSCGTKKQESKSCTRKEDVNGCKKDSE